MGRPQKTLKNTLNGAPSTKHGNAQTPRTIRKMAIWITVVRKTFSRIFWDPHQKSFPHEERWRRLNCVNKFFELLQRGTSVSHSLKTPNSLLCFDMLIQIAPFQIVGRWPKLWKGLPRTRGLHWKKNWQAMIWKSVWHWMRGHPTIILHF